MNSTIIKGTMKVGLGKAVKKWGNLTGNRSLYAKGLAEEWIGKSQRSYGRLKDTSESLTKTVVKKVKNLHIEDRAKDLNKTLMKKVKNTNMSMPTFAMTALTVGLIILRDRK